MNENLEELIKKNKGILRQLTSLNNKIKKLKIRIKKLEQKGSYYPTEADLEEMNLYEGSD